MNEIYLLPEENALATEINFAIKKYNLLKSNNIELIKKMNENKNWIINPDFMSTIALKLHHGIESAGLTDNKSLNYLRNLETRVKLQKEIVLSSKIPFSLPNITCEKLTEIKSLSYPIINKMFHYRFETMRDKYETYIALEKLAHLRSYLKDMQPYLNHMSSTYLAEKPNYYPNQIEFALPILFQIQKAKDLGIPEKVIDQAIGSLNENLITSPEHFKASIYSLNTDKTAQDYTVVLHSTENINNEIKSTVSETSQTTLNSQSGTLLSAKQLSIIGMAKNATLMHEIGGLMSKEYISDDLAIAIVKNVNAIIQRHPSVDISHLTQTLSLVGQTSKMTPAEMNILSDIILNNNIDLSFANLRLYAHEIKKTSIKKSWTPCRKEETLGKKKSELAIQNR
jgi:hypothetical protein